MSRIPQPHMAPLLRGALRTVFCLLGGITVSGAENVPSAGPVLFCPNHQSDCDPAAMYIASPRRDIYFMAKEELFGIRIFGAMIRSFGSFPVKRGTADRGAIREAEGVLGQDNALVIFPEGRLSETGDLLEFQLGAAMIAIRSGATIIPVGIAHTRDFMPYSAVIPKRSRVAARVTFGSPVVTSHYTGRQGRAALKEITAAVESEIRRLTGR